MEIDVQITQGISIFRLTGEMDLYNSAEFRELFNRYFTQGYLHYVFNLSELTYIDSTGVGTIIATFTTIRKQKGTLYISGVNGVVKRVIEFTKLNGFLPIVHTLEDALEKTKGKGVKVDPAADERVTGTNSSGITQFESHPLCEKKGMFHKEFNLDLKKVRYLSRIIVQNAPPEIREINLLEQQVSEIIKNAVRHGNKNNPNKKTKIWFAFDKSFAHIIVEDEGVVFNSKGNAVAVKRSYN